MDISYLCIVITIFIPLISVGYAKLSVKGYDNRSPRQFLSKLEGKAKRANAAQMNSYEVFPPFAVGVIVAHLLHAAQSTLDTLAITFVAARILYCFFYIQDNHVLRSTVWFIGFFATITLFFIGN